MYLWPYLCLKALVVLLYVYSGARHSLGLRIRNHQKYLQAWQIANYKLRVLLAVSFTFKCFEAANFEFATIPPLRFGYWSRWGLVIVGNSIGETLFDFVCVRFVFRLLFLQKRVSEITMNYFYSPTTSTPFGYVIITMNQDFIRI